MPSCGAFQRSPALFAATTKSLVQNRRCELAIDLYNEVKHVFQVTKVTYNTLIDALVRQGDMARAQEIFREMAMYGAAPDLISYSTLIRGHCTRGDLEQGLQLLSQMQRRGIVPDAVLFNSILDGCAHKQMRTLTEQVLKDMDKVGVTPSNFTISILVKLYGRCGDVSAAFQVVHDLPRRFGFEVNTQVYTCLMAACISNGELSRALEVYDTIGHLGLTCDAKMYHTLLTGCVRVGNLQAATLVVRDALREAEASQTPLVLDRDAVESVLLMAVRLGKASAVAAPLLRDLQASGFSVSDRAEAAVFRN
jgi:pentatricopeptide repeat protein